MVCLLILNPTCAHFNYLCPLRTYYRVQNANSLSAWQQEPILNLAHQSLHAQVFQITNHCTKTRRAASVVISMELKWEPNTAKCSSSWSQEPVVGVGHLQTVPPAPGLTVIPLTHSSVLTSMALILTGTVVTWWNWRSWTSLFEVYTSIVNST